MNNLARLPNPDDVHRIGGNGLLVILRALFLEVAETSNDKPFEGAPFPLGELDTKARRRSLDTLRSLKRRELATYTIHRGFALVTLTDKGRVNATAMASWTFGIEWLELDFGRYLFVGFHRCECRKCGALFYVRRKRTWCGEECKAALKYERDRRVRLNALRKNKSADPIADEFDARHADELTDFAESVLASELNPPARYELKCRECGKPFVGKRKDALHCSATCCARVTRRRARMRERELVG